jgi:hypothetical protein
MKVFKDLRSLNRGEWGNIFTAMLIAAFVDIALWACGVLIGFGEGGTPTAYWVIAGVFGAFITIGLIGGGLWGSLDRQRMDALAHNRPPTAIPHELLLPQLR